MSKRQIKMFQIFFALINSLNIKNAYYLIIIIYIYIYSGEKIKTTFLKLISEKG